MSDGTQPDFRAPLTLDRVHELAADAKRTWDPDRLREIVAQLVDHIDVTTVDAASGPDYNDNPHVGYEPTQEGGDR